MTFSGPLGSSHDHVNKVRIGKLEAFDGASHPSLEHVEKRVEVRGTVLQKIEYPNFVCSDVGQPWIRK